MNTMRAAVIRRFGGAEELILDHVPIPEIGDDQVLIRVAYAGVGTWDLFEREGGYAEMLGVTPPFPYILGSEGAGEVVEIGKAVTRFRVGDAVCASGFLNPKGGFYAEYAAVDAETVSCIPSGYTFPEAGVFTGVGLTALRGLTDVLELRAGEKIGILGAGGGIGHMAAQIAQSIGARVCAVVSGNDGIGLMRKLGIDEALSGHTTLDGHDPELPQEMDAKGFRSFDKVLLTAGGPVAEEVCRRVRPGGTVAFPSGVFPEPERREGVRYEKYNGDPDGDILGRLVRAVERYEIKPHIDRVFTLEEAVEAHRFSENHYLGKIALKVMEG